MYIHTLRCCRSVLPSIQRSIRLLVTTNEWWKLKEEFETSSTDLILMTTNCIVPPADKGKDRLFTTGAAGYPGCKLSDVRYGEIRDFSEINELAKKCPAPNRDRDRS